MRVKLKTGEIIEVIPNDTFSAAKYINKRTSEYVFSEEIDEILKDATELTWQDVKKLCALSFAVEVDLGRGISDAQHYGEVLRRFREGK